jgi:hypothetical protein
VSTLRASFFIARRSSGAAQLDQRPHGTARHTHL